MDFELKFSYHHAYIVIRTGHATLCYGVSQKKVAVWFGADQFFTIISARVALFSLSHFQP